MAKVMRAMPDRKRPSKYPWHDWFDGRVRELTVGVDFKTTIECFRSTIGVAAKLRGVKVITRAIGDKLYLQAQLKPGASA